MPLQTRWGPGITLLNFRRRRGRRTPSGGSGAGGPWASYSWWRASLGSCGCLVRLAPQDGDVDYDSYVRDEVWFRSAAFLQGPGAVGGSDSHSAGPSRLLPARLLSGPRGPGQRFPPAKTKKKKKKGIPAGNTCKGSSEVLAGVGGCVAGASRPPRLSTSPPSPFVPLRLQKKRSAWASGHC